MTKQVTRYFTSGVCYKKSTQQIVRHFCGITTQVHDGEHDALEAFNSVTQHEADQCEDPSDIYVHLQQMNKV